MVKFTLLSSLAATSYLFSGTNAVKESCNPLKESDCPADTALGTTIQEDFSSKSKYFTSEGNPGNITYGDNGLEITLQKRFDNPSIESNFYIMYGKFEVFCKAAPGQGMVSSVFLQSDDLDELDIEWLGGDDTQVQSNFFSKGDTTTYDRGAFHGVYEPQTTIHNYTLDWSEDQTVWYIDGEVVRTLLSTDPQGYPQSPMKLYMGIWAGGDPSNPEGTIEWAGGLTDYTKAPYSMVISNITITDYSSGSEYTYSDTTGSGDSIKATKGSVNGRYQKAQQEFAKLVGSSFSSSANETTSASNDTSSSSSKLVSSINKSTNTKTTNTHKATTVKRTTKKSTQTKSANNKNKESDSISSVEATSSITSSSITSSKTHTHNSTTTTTHHNNTTSHESEDKKSTALLSSSSSSATSDAKTSITAAPSSSSAAPSSSSAVSSSSSTKKVKKAKGKAKEKSSSTTKTKKKAKKTKKESKTEKSDDKEKRHLEMRTVFQTSAITAGNPLARAAVVSHNAANPVSPFNALLAIMGVFLSALL